jgi:hypothetical protein
MTESPEQEREKRRRRVAMNHALASNNPAVRDMLDRLLAVTEIAHGEEIAEAMNKPTPAEIIARLRQKQAQVPWNTDETS